MNSKRIVALLGTLIYLVTPLSATAATITFTCSSGYWDNENCWDPAQVPADGDHVVIPANKVCTVNISTAICDSFDVDGTLNIANGAVLTIDSDSTVDGGGVRLLGATSKLKLLWNPSPPPPDPTRDVYITSTSGNGKIDCDDGSIQITSELQLRLISRVEITGTVDIYGLGGTFVNEGKVVVPDDGDVITVDTEWGFTDTPGDRWTVTGPNCSLIFRASVGQIDSVSGFGNYQLIDNVNGSSFIRFEVAADTGGRLEMEGGYLDIRQNVFMGDDYMSNRHMQATGGKIVVDPGKQFKHR